MESVASDDWSSTTESDSSLDNDDNDEDEADDAVHDDDDDDDVEEQETQSTIEPLSPDYRGRAAAEANDLNEREAEEEDGERRAKSARENNDDVDDDKDDLKTPCRNRGSGGGHLLSKNDSSEHLLGAKSSAENSPAYSPQKKLERPVASGLHAYVEEEKREVLNPHFECYSFTVHWGIL